MQESIKFELVNKNLWELFHFYGNEMIITKVGRRIFPAIDIKISNLDPNKYYGLFLEFTRTTSNRYKYSSKSGWTVGRPSDIPHVSSFYHHPGSPALGSHWMSDTIVFDKVLFSNSMEVTQNVIILSSMHKYLPQIHIYEIDNFCKQSSNFHLSINFPETSFVAVTAYQNSQITELKVQNNKYANGHRMKHDQDKTKIKEQESNKSDNFSPKLHEDDVEVDTEFQDSDKPHENFYDSRPSCSLSFCHSPNVFPIHPEFMNANFVPFGLLPWKFGSKEFNSQHVEKLNKNDKHENDVKSYTDFTIRKILNIT